MAFNRVAYKQYRCNYADTKLTPTDGIGSTLFMEDRDLYLRWTGLFWRPIVVQSPTKGCRHGAIYPNPTTYGEDAMADLTVIGTAPTIVYIGSGGSKQMAHYLPMTTPQQRGWKAGTGNPTTNRALNPYVTSRIRIGAAIDVMRFYFGWTSSPNTIGSTDTPLANLSGLLVGYRDQDANYQIFHNSGLASEPAPIATTSTKTLSTTRIIEILADDLTPKFSVSIGGAALQNVTTDIPASTTDLYFHFVEELVSGTAAHSIYHMGTEFFDGL
jgi:hypothetical protein